jgi:RNA polymerase sigma-70 factor, ECF subfamily
MLVMMTISFTAWVTDGPDPAAAASPFACTDPAHRRNSPPPEPVTFAPGPDLYKWRARRRAPEEPTGEAMSAAAKAGPAGPATDNPAPDQAEFARLTDPFRSELLAHCYRMLGSVHDAEDQVQETLLRAWRSFDQFEGRASLRTWLYRIATNACLRAIETRRRRPLPSGLGQPGDNPAGPMPAARPEVPWLEPFPDALLPAGPSDPASIAASRASIRLAFIAALQYLPARQRAVLILRDVLDWRASEVAELLGTTATATNSALQRARAQLQQAAPREDELREPADPGDLALLNRYAAAFENADIATLTGLLRDDVVLEMPPLPAWFTGRENIGLFLRSHVLRQPGDFRMIPIAANGQPALAAYRRTPDGTYHANGIEILTTSASRITRVTAFLDPTLFPAFALPAALPRS